MFEFPSRWLRFPRANGAQRLLGELSALTVTLAESGQTWNVRKVRGQPAHTTAAWTLPVSSAPTLDDALELVDMADPPQGWRYDNGRWVRTQGDTALCVVRDADIPVWHVRLDENPVGQKTFATSDAARRWCEVRSCKVTVGGSVRGAKPRKESAATTKLPEVRATTAERAQIKALSERLQLTQSDLTRAALRFVAAHTGTGGALDLRVQDGEPTFYLRTSNA